MEALLYLINHTAIVKPHNILRIAGVAQGSISKVATLASASINKVSGVQS